MSQDLTKPFPLHSYSARLGFRPLTWALVEHWRDRIEANHGQTLEAIAKRGGLDHFELCAAAHGVGPTRLGRHIDPEAWMRRMQS